MNQTQAVLKISLIFIIKINISFVTTADNSYWMGCTVRFIHRLTCKAIHLQKVELVGKST